MARYLAFISYRHLDNVQMGRQWATWLHQALETYEVPEALVGTTNSRGETIPERIYPVFRDEEALPADADLSNVITRALDESQFLIVLCSPSARQSAFVADEIRYFKQLGRADRLLAAIIEGEPNASLDRDKQAAGFTAADECFPEPLQYLFDAEGQMTRQRTEPVAADFRVTLEGRKQQGWTSPQPLRQQLESQSLDKTEIDERVAQYRDQLQRMLLKIVAGILGIPLDELTRRDRAYQLQQARLKARRLRQWLATVGVLAVLTAMAGLFAWQQREQATRANIDLQQRNAELLQMQLLRLPDLETQQGIEPALTEAARLLTLYPHNRALSRYYNATLQSLQPLSEVLAAQPANSLFQWRGKLYLTGTDSASPPRLITGQRVARAYRADHYHFVVTEYGQLLVLSPTHRLSVPLNLTSLPGDETSEEDEPFWMGRMATDLFVLMQRPWASYAGAERQEVMFLNPVTEQLTPATTTEVMNNDFWSAGCHTFAHTGYQPEQSTVLTALGADSIIQTEQTPALSPVQLQQAGLAPGPREMPFHHWLEHCADALIPVDIPQLTFPSRPSAVLELQPVSALSGSAQADNELSEAQPDWDPIPLRRALNARSNPPIFPESEVAQEASWAFWDSVLNGRMIESDAPQVIEHHNGYSVLLGVDAGPSTSIDLWRFDQAGRFIERTYLADAYESGVIRYLKERQWLIFMDSSDFSPDFLIYDLNSGERRTPQDTPARVMDFQLSPQGRFLTLNDPDGHLWIYQQQPDGYQLLHREAGLELLPGGLLEDGRALALTSTGALRLFELIQPEAVLWQRLLVDPASPGLARQFGNQAWLSDDHRLLVVLIRDQLQRLDLETGLMLGTPRPLKLPADLDCYDCELTLQLSDEGAVRVTLTQEDTSLQWQSGLPGFTRDVPSDSALAASLGNQGAPGYRPAVRLPGVDAQGVVFTELLPDAEPQGAP